MEMSNTQMNEMISMMKQMMENMKAQQELDKIEREELKQQIEELKGKKKKGPRTERKVYKTSTKTAPIKDINDFNAFLSVLKPKYKLLVWVGIATNLRISDMLLLTYGDIRYGEKRVIESKTQKAKDINVADSEFAAEIFPLIETIGFKSDDEYLFTSNKKDENGNSKPITRQMAWIALKNAAIKVGLRFVNEEGRLIQAKGIRIGTHTLRKTFSYWFLQEHNDLVRLSKILNHSNTKVTEEYLGIEQEELKKMQGTAIGGFYKKVKEAR